MTPDFDATVARYRALGATLEPRVERARLDRNFDSTVMAAVGASGLFAAAQTPDEDFTAAAAAVAGLCYALRDTGFATSMIIHHCVCHIVGRFGSDALRSAIGPALSDGSRPCSVAMTEPQGGSAAFEMKTSIVDQRLAGDKWHITNAPVAFGYVVFAREIANAGPTAVFVRHDDPGVVVEALRPSGMRGSAIGKIQFRDVPLDESRRFGGAGEGISVFGDATTREKILIAFACVGLFERLRDDMMDYAETRVVSGEKLGRHQYVRQRLTDVTVGLEATRGLAFAALRAWQTGSGDASLLSAVAKLHAAEFAIEASVDAMKLFGSHGFADGGLSDLLLGSVGASLGGGSEEAQREIVYKQLLLARRRRRPLGAPKPVATAATTEEIQA